MFLINKIKYRSFLVSNTYRYVGTSIWILCDCVCEIASIPVHVLVLMSEHLLMLTWKMIWPNIGMAFYVRLPVIIYIELTTRIIVPLISQRWTYIFCLSFWIFSFNCFPLCGPYICSTLNALRIVDILLYNAETIYFENPLKCL